MRFLYTILIASSLLFGAELSPRLSIKASGNVQNIVIHKDHIVAGTNAGTIDVYQLSDGAMVQKIVLESIKDFTGDTIAPKVFSVDALEGSETYLAVVQASSGARRLVVVEKGVVREVIPASDNAFITKAKFIDANHALLALMSNELILLELKTGKKQYQAQINPSHFSDFALNESKSVVASSCESGEITLSEVATGKTQMILSGGNVDNVYKVDFKNQKVLAAGQDRRGIVYDTKNKRFERFDGEFLLYAGALSPTANKAAFAFNEQNDIVIFDLVSKAKQYILKGQKSTLNTIVFVGENELVSGSDDQFILLWRLP